MALNDIVGQLPPQLRRAKVTDIETGSQQSIASRLTTHTICYFNNNAPAGTTGMDDSFLVTIGEYYLLQARYLPHAAVTANDTDFLTISIWDGTNTYFSKNTTIGQGSWTDNVAVTLSPVPVDQTVADGVTLRLRVVKSGVSGVAMVVGSLQLMLAERIA